MSLLRRRMMLNSAVSALSNPKLLFSAENMKISRTDGEVAEQGVGVTEYYPVQVNQKVVYFNPLTSHTTTNNLGSVIIYDSSKQFVDWWNCIANGNEGSFTQSNANGAYFRLNVVMDTEADVYCYNQTTGQIYYAGINTPYYGKQNIND